MDESIRSSAAARLKRASDSVMSGELTGEQEAGITVVPLAVLFGWMHLGVLYLVMFIMGS
jgi:hypothetical protein